MPNRYCDSLIFRLTISVFVGLTAAFYNGKAAVCQTIQADNSLGAESSIDNSSSGIVVDEVPINLIQGGAKRGANLFHSFTDFNVPQGQAVYFENPTGVEHIISRVTGSNRSEIYGTLGIYKGTADLFLINPNGIIFGPNAKLNLSGSFLGTTAESLNFSDGEYSAKGPSSEPLLSSSIPAGLRFGEMPGSIANQSQAIGSFFGDVIPLGLQVKPDKTLALIGGNIDFNAGLINSPSAHIDIGSVSNLDEVGLYKTDQGWSPRYNTQNLGVIRLTQNSKIAAQDGGSISLHGKNISIINSQIAALSFAAPGDDIIISAADTFELTSNNPRNPAALITQTYSGDKGGDIKIDAKKLILQGDAAITSLADDKGKAGDIFVTARDVTLNNGGYIEASTDGGGIGGTIQFGSSSSKVDSINISGVNAETEINSALRSTSLAEGNSGNIILFTHRLNISNGGEISVNSSSSGTAGDIDINARSIKLENQGFIDAGTTSGSGNITLNASNIFLRNNSDISTSATGDASGGNINITAGVLVGLENSNISANAETSSGGNVEISAKGIFGFVPRTSTELQQILGTSDLSQFDPTDSIKFPTSDISAISQASPSLDGQVILKTPNVDPSKGLVNLPTTVVDPSALIAQTPCKRGVGSELTRSGRGGLPPSIVQDLSSNATEVGLIPPLQLSTEKKAAPLEPKTQLITPSTSISNSAVVPARGWVFDPKGNVVLVASAVSTDTDRSNPGIAGCSVR